MAIRRNPPPGVQKAPRPTTTAPTKASGATTPATTPVADKAPPSDPAAIFVDNREAPPRENLPQTAAQLAAMPAGPAAFTGRNAALAIRSAQTKARQETSLFSRLFGGGKKAGDLEQTPAYAGLDATQRAQLSTISAQASPGAQAALQELMSPPAGQPSLLLQTAKSGQTLLAVLAGLADAKLRETSQTGVQGRDVMNDLLEHIADPGTITQGHFGTCSVTSMQYALCKSLPAEFASLVSDLARTGKATLADGTVMDAGYQGPSDVGCGRSHPGRLFQTAAMGLFAPPGFHYTPAADGFVNMRTKEVRASAGARTSRIDDVWSKILGAPVPERMASQETNKQVRDPEKAAALYQLLTESGNAETLLSVTWTTSGHLLSFEGMDEDRVLMRDPNGHRNPGWLTQLGFGLEVVDDERGLLSMSKETFIARLQGVFIPELPAG